jgi:hypothetical protein
MDFDVHYQAKLHPGCQSTGFLGHPDQDYSKQHYPPNWILQI